MSIAAPDPACDLGRGQPLLAMDGVSLRGLIMFFSTASTCLQNLLDVFAAVLVGRFQVMKPLLQRRNFRLQSL